LGCHAEALLTPLPSVTAHAAVYYGSYADQHNTTAVKGVKPIYRTTNACRAAGEEMNVGTEMGIF